ncbi:MAG: GNAT family N-acetyltransferase [Chloroflexi bacterium]|nr:GNAT family N-acetyltransferase [Chloroflexota bacterium]
MTESGYCWRALTLDDARRCAEISTAVSACAGAGERFQPRDLRAEWTEPNFDLSASSLGAADAQGRLIAFAVFFATQEPPVRPYFNWGLDPAHGDPKLRAKLLSWAIDRGKSVIASCPPDARVSLWGGAYRGYSADESALHEAGFSPGRLWHEMHIDMIERPAAVALPNGFVIRPYCHEADLPILVDLVRDSFSDHYGHIEQSFERDLEMFRHWLDSSPVFDPDRVLLAMDEATGIVAGGVVPLREYQRRPGVGYIDMVGVRRAYRRRGLASAMLIQSFAEYWDRGIKAVCLEVDGESLTNALALYERVGMRVQHSFVSYEKLLRDGVELAKVAVK